MSILAFTMHDEFIYAERCLKAGAKGYLMKQEAPEKVVDALRRFLKGDIYVSKKLSTKLIHKYVDKRDVVSASSIELLSNRELEVFQHIGQGLKIRKIAENLNLSKKTIETYVDHLKKKMNFEHSRELFVHAVKFANNT